MQCRLGCNHFKRAGATVQRSRTSWRPRRAWPQRAYPYSRSHFLPVQAHELRACRPRRVDLHPEPIDCRRAESSRIRRRESRNIRLCISCSSAPWKYPAITIARFISDTFSGIGARECADRRPHLRLAPEEPAGYGTGGAPMSGDSRQYLVIQSLRSSGTLSAEGCHCYPVRRCYRYHPLRPLRRCYPYYPRYPYYPYYPLRRCYPYHPLRQCCRVCRRYPHPP